MYQKRVRLCIVALLVIAVDQPHTAQGADLEQALRVVRTASPVRATGGEVRRAWKALAAADAADIPTILRGMTGSNPAVENWLRAAADTVAERTLDAGGNLPAAELTELLDDVTASPRARRTAFEWLEEIDAERAHQMLARMTDDPSLEIRYDAIAAELTDIEASTDEKNTLARLQILFRDARNLDQIKNIKAQLEELGQEIDLARHMGFVTTWRVIGTFDNTNKAGYDVAYPPESEIDLTATYDGKDGQAAWRDMPTTTDDEYGKIDLNEVVGAKKGAIAYAFAAVEAPKSRTAVVRYASPNATKLWVNGQLAADNEVYHAGGVVDQYAAPVVLSAGTNQLLLKVCQNEQTEPWAQDWNFQLRVTDELGGAIDVAPAEVK
jgi:hypothetical protein